MKGKLHYLILILVLNMVALSVQAQNLTEFDKDQIERRAKLKMDEFEELLFLISDPTRSRGAIDRYILSSYSREDSLFNQVFYNEDVMIEDDISPIVLTKDNIEVSAIDIVTYLNNFKLQYRKYVEKTVFFTDLSFSEVMQEERDVYVVASYKSEFRGRNTNYKDYQYQPVKRKATLRAEYNYGTDAWQVWIVGVNFDRAGSEPVDSLLAIEKEPLNQIREEENDVTVVQAEQLSNQTETTVSRKEEELPALQFTSNIPESIKRGKSVALKWNNAVDNASMSLYQGEQEVMKLREGVKGQQWNWTVQQKPGKDYSIMLYEPSSNSRIKSSPFIVKSSFPLIVKVAIPVVAMGTAFWLYNKNKPCDDCPSEDKVIDIEPTLPE